MLLPGDPAPCFQAASSVNPKFSFDTVAGRFVVLSFFGSTKHEFSRRLLDEAKKRSDRFDVTNVVFFGVSVDPEDKDHLSQESPGVMYFWDFDLAISRLYDVAATSTNPQGLQSVPLGDVSSEPKPSESSDDSIYQPRTVLLDQALRVLAIVPFSGEPSAHLDSIFKIIDGLPRFNTVTTPAPVLMVPYVFEPELCKALIDYYQSHGGEDSGFMREVAGKTVGIKDYSHKRRADCDITDDALIRTTQERLARRVIPAIRQAYQFNATRIERHIVACYDSTDGGHFRAHRDNTTKGTAHRRFAVTINLNATEYEGGELWFPEFSPRRYRPQTGGAVVFSCSLLHEATPVTAGKRYAFLPFLYDDAAARIRQENLKFIGANA